MSKETIANYYAAFNQENLEKFCDLLAEEVIHIKDQANRMVFWIKDLC